VKLADSFFSTARLALVPRRLRSAPPALQRAHADAVVVSAAVLGGPFVAGVTMEDGPLDRVGVDSALLAVGKILATTFIARRARLTRRLVDAGRAGRPECGECLHPLPVDHGDPESVSAAGSGCLDDVRCVECGAVHDRSAMASWMTRVRSVRAEEADDNDAAIREQEPAGPVDMPARGGNWPEGLQRLGITPWACWAVGLAFVALLVWIGGMPMLSTGGVSLASAEVLLVIRVLALAGAVIAVERAFLSYANIERDDPSVPPGGIAFDAPGSGIVGLM